MISLLTIRIFLFGSIVIPGILCATGYFWHISDFHYDPTYLTTQTSCRDDVTRSKMGHFGHYVCDSPWPLVEDALANMARIQPYPDFIIWTGDTVLHFTRDEGNVQMHLMTIENVTDAITRAFPSTTMVPSLGNHEFYPSDEASGTGSSPMYDAVSDLWEHWIVDQSQMQFFRKGGYFSKLVLPGLRVMSVNTVLFYYRNTQTENMTDPGDQFQWMTQELSDAREKGEKVIITGHIQPGMRTPGLIQMYYPDFTTRYIELITNYSDVIVASHYGHDHADGFKLLNSDRSSGVVAQFTAASVTPRRNGLGAHNPGVRLVEYDRETGRHLNYMTYFMDLTESNKNMQSDWKEIYNFRDAYGVPDMTTTSLQNIYTRMVGSKIAHHLNISPHVVGPGNLHVQEEEKLFPQYCHFMVLGAVETPCGPKERAEIWCGGLSSDSQKAKECVQLLVDKFSHDDKDGASSLGDEIFTKMIYLLVAVALLIHNSK